ncbi:MAG: L-serine ammonia-lyase, partial [Burkholderiaceae bacterium]|nr:L-serine ammonia-lyase [Burkholderiaceae bacterium]
GPMRAARMFVQALADQGVLERVHSLRCELYGSLGATGKGHGTDRGVLLGLMGETPDGVDVDGIEPRIAQLHSSRRLALLGGAQTIDFNPREHLLFYRREALAEHPNGMKFSAFDAQGALLREGKYLSVGGGFVVTAGAANSKVLSDYRRVPYPFASGDELLALCARERRSIAQLMLANECTWRSAGEVRAGLLAIWRVMQACVARGCAAPEGSTLPGPFKVRR